MKVSEASVVSFGPLNDLQGGKENTDVGLMELQDHSQMGYVADKGCIFSPDGCNCLINGFLETAYNENSCSLWVADTECGRGREAVRTLRGLCPTPQQEQTNNAQR